MLILREVTERLEVEAGVMRVVGTNAERVVAETFRLLNDSEAYVAMARPVNLYGDGYSAERIVETILGCQADEE